MKFWKKSIVVAVAALGSLFFGSTAGAEAEPVEAAALCPGTLVHSFESLGGWVTVEEYYSSADNGTNCAVVVKNVGVGTAEYMQVLLDRCQTGNPNNPCRPTIADFDDGNFTHYAGPVRVRGTSDVCVALTFSLRHNGVTRNGEHGPAHCG